MHYVYVILGAVFVGNFYMLLRRRSKSRKSNKNAVDEYTTARTRHAALERRLSREQEDAARRVDLQNKTFEMYEQCRQNAREAERESDSDNE